MVRDAADNAPVTGGNRSGGHGPGSARRVIPPADERGATLVEVVLTVILVGLVVVTLVSALFTMTVASDRHRRLAVADAELRRYAEWLRARPYVVCAPAGDASPYGFDAVDDPDVPAGLTARVVRVELFRYDDPTDGLAGDWVAVAPDCGGPGGQVDEGLQRVVVELESGAGTDGSFTRTASLVKRTTELSS